MLKTASTIFLTLTGILLAGCVDKPNYGRNNPYPATHVQFTSSALQDATAITPAVPTRDPSGLLLVTMQIRSTVDHDLAIDVYCTFTRAGQVVDNRLGPKVVNLQARSTETITFNSTAPADDFQLIFGPAQ
jgi:starvation-inducible outer membrane lipoprotein